MFLKTLCLVAVLRYIIKKPTLTTFKCSHTVIGLRIAVVSLMVLFHSGWILIRLYSNLVVPFIP